MNRRALIITPDIQTAINKVKKYGEEHPVSLIDLVKMMNGEGCVGDDPGRCIEIPCGYRVVYSQEYQQTGLCDHLSISVDSKQQEKGFTLPHHLAVDMVAAAFGIEKKNYIGTWIEPIDYGGGGAVNLISMVKENECIHDTTKSTDRT